MKSHFKHLKVLLSHNNIATPTPWKPGGNILIITGIYANNISDIDNDYLDRRNRITLSRKDQKRLIVYNIYSVCDMKPEQAGHFTIVKQQW